jgi:hypothetical protein
MASALGTAIGGSELGYGLSMNPQINLQNPMTELGPDQTAINQQMGTQQGITNTGLQGQQGLNNQSLQQQQGILGGSLNQLNNVDQNQMQQLTSQLGPNGSLGQQLSGEFANYGITPQSGAFQEGLANQYGNLAMQQQQQNANLIGQGYGNQASAAQMGQNDLNSIYGQGVQTQSGLGQTGLQNYLGLESQGVDTQNAQALAQFMQQAGLQSSLIGAGGSTLGQSSSGGKG